MTPMIKARRRRKRQHLHRCRKCQRRRHRPHQLPLPILGLPNPLVAWFPQLNAESTLFDIYFSMVLYVFSSACLGASQVRLLIYTHTHTHTHTHIYIYIYIHTYIYIYIYIYNGQYTEQRKHLLPRCLFWSSGHALSPLAPERLFCPALSFCGVNCML